MPNLIFINRFFYPDHSATSQLLTDLACNMDESADFADLHIITSRLRYDNPQATLAPRETLKSITIHRVWTSRFGRARLTGRALDYATFYLSAAWCLFSLSRKNDVVVVKTDPPLLAVVLLPVLWLRRARLINWVQDLFPEVAEQLGIRLARGWPGRSLRYLRNVTFRQAYANVVLGERMAQRLRDEGVPATRIQIIHNWADEAIIYPVAAVDNPLRDEWRCKNKFVVGYSGNMGRAHEFETLLGAAERLQAYPDIVFILVGGGARKPLLEERARELGLRNLQFYPYQPWERLAYSLSLPDVHLISLQPALEGLIVPSKFYSVCAAGRPTLFIGDPTGELAGLITRYQCGAALASGDIEGLTAGLLEFRNNPMLTTESGERAREAFLGHFSRKRALTAWRMLLGNFSR